MRIILSSLALAVSLAVFHGCRVRIEEDAALADTTIPGQFMGEDYQIYNWLTSTYVDLIRRTPTAEEVNIAISRIKSSQDRVQSRTDIAFEVITSVDGAKAEISRFYRLYLKRPPEQNGLNGWLSRMLARSSDGEQYKKDTKQIQLGFLASLEYQNNAGRQGGANNAALVKAYYRDLFGREADPEGIRLWTAQLDSGWTPEKLLEALMGTPEYQLNNARMVQRWFRIYLRRDADVVGGMQFVIALQNQLKNNETLEKVKASFFGSNEYYNLVKYSEDVPFAL